ncbi:MAG: hypothetical protein WD036_04775 [Bauldia sp.]
MKPRRDDAADRWAKANPPTREEIDRDLARKVAAWARSWERCPLAGCRRNKRCLKQGHCRTYFDRPMTEEERLFIREQIDKLVANDASSD